MRCEPDKYRFCDPEAMANRFLVHTVEVSDRRSVQQFVTFWTKGVESGHAWAARHKLGMHHNRDVYHREPDPWLPAQYPGMESRGWSKHFHLDLQQLPTWADVVPFLDEVPPTIQDALREHWSTDGSGTADCDGARAANQGHGAY